MTLLYFAPVPWDSYAQRPHYFARHFLRGESRSVIWVDPYPSRLPAWRDLRRLGEATQTTTRPPNLTVLSLYAPPIEPLPGGRWLHRRFLWRRLRSQLEPLIAGRTLGVGVGRPSALALEALDTLRPAWSVYDAMDDFPDFYRGWSRDSVDGLERAIASRVDLILTASAGLWTKFSAHGSKRVMVRNAFEMSSLPPAAQPAGDPVFGYIGCVGDWFDWSLVCSLARSAPHASVHIVGPRFVTPRRLPKNITLLPACPHEQGVEHLRRFSVGLIPFKQTRLTEAVDPIKYYAYRGMGLPVLSTRFGGMSAHSLTEGTHFFDGSGGLVRAVSRALDEQSDVGTIERFRTKHDWRRRFGDAGLFECFSQR